ncbi:MAG: 23S rRNA (pseudouridine(1915)-N(3))-methyltransferase RlmH [Alphaproteobacteria bacterium]|nr:23S rRNA (pseudouridine(1915)-N(3))-methyltransferase RlmH [Alphaproteobacteria bacterium]
MLIVAVGRLKRGALAELVAEYAKRLPWTLRIKEIEPAAARRADELIRRESDALRAALPGKGRVVVLDSTGQSLDSERFAVQLRQWQDSGVPTVSFVIGGAEGLDRALVREADLVLAFGAMTWPHLMVRAMLAEQLFRAASQMAGHPYHRGQRG